ncbi:hypothetical protein SCUCBS95973_004859 [Sporothrix curviconia]|uniref:Uncharacterized protein n=1 Tax=Sporothrix curviconia TaxID=1260050 RepID=A0ABP0BSG8_9PEZI
MAIQLASLRAGPLRYNSPWTQVILVGFVAFSSVGIFSAIGGRGAGGTQDVQLVDISNSALYATFTIMGFFAGSVNLGTLIGAAIALDIQFHSTLPGVSTGVYVTFLIIQLTAIGTSWLVLPPAAVVRADGSLVELEPHLSAAGELRAFAGMFRASFQGLAYYSMSSLTNDPFKLARMAGYYKGVQSAGSAVSFGIDAVHTPYLRENLVSWLLTLVSLFLCFIVLMHTRDTNVDVEQTTFVDDMEPEKLKGISVPQGHEAGKHESPEGGLTEPTTSKQGQAKQV